MHLSHIFFLFTLAILLCATKTLEYNNRDASHTNDVAFTQGKRGRAIRLRRHPSVRNKTCKYKFIRVPKTGSTALHNAIVTRPELSRLICSSPQHTGLHQLSQRNSAHVLYGLRDPVARFVSAYRYGYADIGQLGKPRLYNLGRKYNSIDSFVNDLHSDPTKAERWLKELVFSPQFMWTSLHPSTQENKDQKRHPICVSARAPPFEYQLMKILQLRTLPVDVENDTKELQTQLDDAKYINRPNGYDIPSPRSIDIIKELYTRDVQEFNAFCAKYKEF
eukprot:m.12739 g.12739  ORF g.12739 m.12739 type:complete len:277 (+) comp4729_c0_seq1:43-873(+)